MILLRNNISLELSTKSHFIRRSAYYNKRADKGGVRAREIVGFTGSGPIFETENRFISRPEAEKSVHKNLYSERFCNTQTDIITCQNCSHLIIRYYLA